MHIFTLNNNNLIYYKMFLDPIKKHNKFISIYKNPPIKNIADIKIKSINKLSNNTGYYFIIYISPINNNDIINELIDFDKEIMATIETNSMKWFNKEFTINEISELYNKSFCNQTKTISVILTKKQIKNMMYNNKKVADIEETIDFLNTNKKCVINISIEYYGLYIYSETTSNKWVIKTLDITNIDDEESIISIEDLIDNYRERVSNIKRRSDDKLQKLRDSIEIINKNILSIDNLSELLKSKDTTNKANINNHLIKLSELILKQEEAIKNSI